MKALTGLVIGAGIGALVGFVGRATFLAVAATISGESFDGMGLILFGIIGAPVGLVLGALLGAIVASRLRR